MRSAWGAPAEFIESMKIFKDKGEHGARLLSLILTAFRQLPQEQRSACAPELSQVTDMLDVSPLKRVSLALRLEVLPWIDSKVLPAQLAALCEGTPEFLVEQFYQDLLNVLQRLPSTEEKFESLAKAAMLLEKGNQLAKTAACALALALADQRKVVKPVGGSAKGKGKGKYFMPPDRSGKDCAGHRWQGFPAELLERLKQDEDEGIRNRAFWIAVCFDNENDLGEKEECGLTGAVAREDWCQGEM